MWQIGGRGRLPARAGEGHARSSWRPAERADVIVDFSGVKFGTNVTLRNMGPDAPFGGGGFRPADPLTTGLVMQFRVNQAVSLRFVDPTTPPGTARHAARARRCRRRGHGRWRLLELAAEPPEPDIPIEARLGTFDPTVGRSRRDHVLAMGGSPRRRTPSLGDTEMWELYNFTEDAHPIHIHEVLFEVVNRQRLDKKTGRPIQTPRAPGTDRERLQGHRHRLPRRGHPGPDDVRQPRGQYVWHCHIVEHEDNEMMRPYRIGPVQPGQPD